MSFNLLNSPITPCVPLYGVHVVCRRRRRRRRKPKSRQRRPPRAIYTIE